MYFYWFTMHSSIVKLSLWLIWVEKYYEFYSVCFHYHSARGNKEPLKQIVHTTLVTALTPSRTFSISRVSNKPFPVLKQNMILIRYSILITWCCAFERNNVYATWNTEIVTDVMYHTLFFSHLWLLYDYSCYFFSR